MKKKGSIVMKKRVVVIGYGGMGGWHTRNALKSDVVELAGTFDIKEDRQQAARDNGLPFVGCQYWRMPHEVEEADIKVSRPAQIIAAVKALIG